jgi:hypothetical protein
MCITCGQFICRSIEPFSHAQCEICRRLEQGEKITPELLTAYDLSKIPYQDSLQLTVEEEARNEPRPKLSKLLGMGRGILTALGIKPTEEELRPPPSVEVSREKKIGPLFNDEELK